MLNANVMTSKLQAAGPCSARMPAARHAPSTPVRLIRSANAISESIPSAARFSAARRAPLAAARPADVRCRADGAVNAALVAEEVPPPVVREEAPMTPEEVETILTNTKGAFFFILPGEMNPGVPVTMYVNRNASELLAHKNGLKLHYGFNNWQVGCGTLEFEPSELPNRDGDEWFSATYCPPPDARQMSFVFSAEGESIWDNNEEENYLMTVEDPALRKPIPAETVAAMDAKAKEVWADKYGAAKFFTVPAVLKAGEPGALYYNPKRTDYMADIEPITSFVGFNSWSTGNSTLAMERAPIERHDDIDWWTCKFNVPADAFDVSFAFADSDETVFDNNDDNDYCAQVSSDVERIPRMIASIEEQEHAGGKLEIVKLKPRPTSNRRARWKEERQIRVWTPPGYHKGMGGEEGIPVLYMNDGLNLYEDWLAHQGVSWNAGHTAAALINEGKLPPFIIVGIDSPGPFRSDVYLPFPPGIGKWDHRPDAEKWPGGNVDAYLDRIVNELRPLIADHWGGSMLPERTCFGGASFGGVCALIAAKDYPEVFGSVLAESPSIWSQEGKFLEMMQAHDGEWSQKIFLGSGTKEHSYNKDYDWGELDQLLLQYTADAAGIIESKGVPQGERLAFHVEEGAGHVEGAWGHRLSGSLQFLCSHWWN